MGKINVLDKHVAELIAAGEVVERPASVMKELVENCIDAGASTITAEIKDGGVTYLRVTDNGCGIAREDVPVAFLRHATSKVKLQDDLDSIGTLGFRGEALASIAAVSRVELLTRTSDELAGTRYVIEGGEEQECEDAGCAEGTTLVVRNLFYNTPARMKFLKKDTTESNAIAAVLDKIALSHPEISFRLIRDGKETLHTPGDGKLKSAVYAVFGKEFTEGLIPVEYEYSGVKVWGAVSKPSYARPNRSMQHFFINGRYVKSRTAMVALEEAFKGSLMAGKFPASVLHLNLSFGAVDVNVHPAKLEVRFINERPIFDAVYHGVKTALNRGDMPQVMKLPEKPKEKLPAAPQIPAAKTAEKPQKVVQELISPISSPVSMRVPSQVKIVIEKEDWESTPQKSTSRIPILRDSQVVLDKQVEQEQPIREKEELSEKKLNPEISIESDKEVQPLQTVRETPVKLIGEAFDTYVILQRGREELIFIDKHAAHERLLYEQIKKQSGEAFSQMLLEPIPVTLDKDEYSAVMNSLDLLSSSGFEVEDFGAGTVLVRSAPLSLGREDAASAVMEIAGYLQASKTDITTEHLDWLYHNIACRAAMKGGDDSSPEELMALVKRLEENPDIRYCPHGRPVMFILKRVDLEKQFGRIP